MARPALYRETTPHEYPEYKDTIRMITKRRGPEDDTWACSFFIKGLWQPKDGISLGTPNKAEALSRAVRQHARATTENGAASGVRVQRSYKPPAADHPLRLGLWAEKTIKRLKQQAEDADKITLGKGRNFAIKAWRIAKHLSHKDSPWRDVPLTELTTQNFAAWVRTDLRVRDGKGGWKRPARQTIGNIDTALSEVWKEAVDAKAIAPDVERPIIPRASSTEHTKRKNIKVETAPRALRAKFDLAGVRACAEVMSDEWIDRADRWRPEFKRSFRCYFALLALTGIRTGLEAKRISLANVALDRPDGKISILILPYQGKHKAKRLAWVYVRDRVWDMHTLLREQVAYRRSQGASDTDPLFGNPDGSFPCYIGIFGNVVNKAGVPLDPTTGARRVLYSLRHFYACTMIGSGKIMDSRLSELMGTSAHEIRMHYKAEFAEQDDANVTGE